MNELNTILVVDDFEDTRELARISLEKVGKFEVRVVANGDDALAEFTSWNPDLVLVDLVLSDETGIDVVKRLRDVDAFVRFVFLTGRIATEEVETYRAIGAIGVITKPFNPISLPDDVSRIWNEA